MSTGPSTATASSSRPRQNPLEFVTALTQAETDRRALERLAKPVKSRLENAQSVIDKGYAKLNTARQTPVVDLGKSIKTINEIWSALDQVGSCADNSFYEEQKLVDYYQAHRILCEHESELPAADDKAHAKAFSDWDAWIEDQPLLFSRATTLSGCDPKDGVALASRIFPYIPASPKVYTLIRGVENEVRLAKGLVVKVPPDDRRWFLRPHEDDDLDSCDRARMSESKQWISNYKSGRALQASDEGETAPSELGTSSIGEGPYYQGVVSAGRALSYGNAASVGGEPADNEGASDMDAPSHIDVSSDENEATKDGTRSDERSSIRFTQPGNPCINPLDIDPDAILVDQDTPWAGFGRRIPFEPATETGDVMTDYTGVPNTESSGAASAVGEALY